MKITLTAYQIYKMAQYAGLSITASNNYDKEKEFTITDEVKLLVQNEEVELIKPIIIFCTDSPEELKLIIDQSGIEELK